jgi:hypothetical protein
MLCVCSEEVLSLLVVLVAVVAEDLLRNAGTLFGNRTRLHLPNYDLAFHLISAYRSAPNLCNSNM